MNQPIKHLFLRGSGAAVTQGTLVPCNGILFISTTGFHHIDVWYKAPSNIANVPPPRRLRLAFTPAGGPGCPEGNELLDIINREIKDFLSVEDTERQVNCCASAVNAIWYT